MKVDNKTMQSVPPMVQENVIWINFNDKAIDKLFLKKGGADVKLTSHTSRRLFPYSMECKNRQDFKQLYSYFDQAKAHEPLEPLLAVKMNRERQNATLAMKTESKQFLPKIIFVIMVSFFPPFFYSLYQI